MMRPSLSSYSVVSNLFLFPVELCPAVSRQNKYDVAHKEKWMRISAYYSLRYKLFIILLFLDIFFVVYLDKMYLEKI
jgi:hypothetical protein